MVLMILVISGVMGGAVLFVAAGQEHRDGLPEWGRGLLFNTVAFGFFAIAGGRTHAGALVLGNMMQSAALVAALQAVMAFFAKPDMPLRHGWRLGWPPFTVAGLSLAFAQQALWRIPLVESILAWQAAFLAWTVARQTAPQGGQGRERGALLLVMGMGLLSLIYVQRVVHVGVGRQSAVDLMSSNPWQTLSYMQGLAGLLLSTMGLLLMHKEKAERLLRQMAMQDVLTGIANRRCVMGQLEQVLAAASRQGDPVTIAMIDIDHFKRINDEHGHLVGDGVLAALAAVLRQRLRTQDMLGRYGGEEFLVVLPHTDLAGGLALAESLRARVAHSPLRVGALEVTVTVSVGVHSRIPHHAAQEMPAMIEAADKALYHAKENGRNQTHGSSH